MSGFTVIPAIDLLNGQVVRLTQGDYNQVDRYDKSPVEWAKAFEAAGAKRIHIVDLDGAKAGKPVNHDTILAIRKAVSCELEVGGGLRSQDSLAFYKDAGINYLIIGSMLIKQTQTALDLIHAFPNTLIAGVDCKGDFVAVEGWIQKSKTPLKGVLDLLKNTPTAGVIYTDIAKDGMMQGPNLPALKTILEQTHLPLIASGGVSTEADIAQLRKLAPRGLFGCIVGKALLSGSMALDPTLFQG
ncbi:MAG: HisA/HisF-related TIM barrel protein [Candidatus Margulisiibacteriota bacterium]